MAGWSQYVSLCMTHTICVHKSHPDNLIYYFSNGFNLACFKNDKSYI